MREARVAKAVLRYPSSALCRRYVGVFEEEGKELLRNFEGAVRLRDGHACGAASADDARVGAEPHVAPLQQVQRSQASCGISEGLRDGARAVLHMLAEAVGEGGGVDAAVLVTAHAVGDAEGGCGGRSGADGGDEKGVLAAGDALALAEREGGVVGIG